MLWPAGSAAAQTIEDVRTRDRLIAAQESLLNTYRCRFNIDTQVVPGGCRSGQPANRPAVPPPFNGVPTAEANRVRDELIASQESLLNTYRCRFNIDTQVVPGGCRSGQPANRPADNGSSSGGQSLSVSPASVPAPGVYDFTVTGYGFTVSKANIVVCQTSDVSLVRNSADFFSYCGGFGEQITASAGGIFSTTLKGVTVGDAGVSFLLFEFASDGETASFTIAPTGLVAITVPNSEPNGRCAHLITEGVYFWEQACAWDGYLENPAHNRSISDQDAPALVNRIWSEVVVAGKPANPPTAALVPARTQCALPDENTQTTACYLPGKHHIRRLDSYLDTLLHEVAHALVTGHPSITECRSQSLEGNAYQACVHNDIFRCVANHLYVEYGHIPDAGVCGTARQSSGPSTGAWNSHEYDNGTWQAWTPITVHSMGPPNENAEAHLVIRCSDDFYLDAFLLVEHGVYLPGQDGRIPGSYVFYPKEFTDWDRQRISSYQKNKLVEFDWVESTNDRAAFLPHDRKVVFINDAISPRYEFGEIHLYNQDGEYFGGFRFKTKGAITHIKPVVEDCGLRIR